MTPLSFASRSANAPYTAVASTVQGGFSQPARQVMHPRSFSKMADAHAYDWDDTIGPREKQFVRQQNAQRAHERLFTTDLPISLAASIGTFLLFNQNDAQSRMTKAFQQLVKNRASALETLTFLKEHGIDRRQNRYLIAEASSRLIAPLELMLLQADSPVGMLPLQQRLMALNPSNAIISKLSRSLSQYGQAQQYIVRHPQQLKEMMIPMMTRLLSLSPFQAKVMAASRPQELLNRLFGQSITALSQGRSPLTTTLFNRVFSELASANRRRAFNIAGSVLALLLGVFVTRMEMKMDGA